MHLGDITSVSARRIHPLGFYVARSFIAERIALVGDAAHVIHPIAGQGLNMGLKDVAALAEVIVDAARLGLDPAAADVLERYQRWRRFDTMAMGLATDGLNRLFSNRSAALRLVRDVGLGMVDRVPGLKRLFIREAAGLVGEVPKLLRGEHAIDSRRKQCCADFRMRSELENMAFNHIAVIGAGAWGTALALTCARAGRKVTLWEPDAAQAAHLAQDRESQFLPGVRIDDSIAIASGAAEAARAPAILVVVPAQAVRAVTKLLAPLIAPRTSLIVCAKGIERGTEKFMTEVIAECAPDAVPAILSGPSFAADVARGMPTAVTLAASDDKLAGELAQAIGSASFRPYHSTDVRGVEIGGAAKNVLAIAAGIVAGRGLGASAAAALTTRGFAELVRFGQSLWGKAGDDDGALRPRRSDPDLLEPAVAQLHLRGQSRPRHKARGDPRQASPKARSPLRCWSRWRASATSTCRSRLRSPRCLTVR